jgi:natural product precursor
MKKINLKSSYLKEVLSKEEMKRVIGGALCPLYKWICRDNGSQYSSYDECDFNCNQPCDQTIVGYMQCRG